MEVKRQLDVLDKQLGRHEFVAGEDYTLADMAIWPWYGALALGKVYGDADTFLSVHEYENLQRWSAQLKEREGVRRGMIVSKVWGSEDKQLKERHSAKDIDDALAGGAR
jgi:GST-like protein